MRTKVVVALLAAALSYPASAYRTEKITYDNAAYLLVTNQYVTVIDFMESENVATLDIGDGVIVDASITRTKFKYRYRRMTRRTGFVAQGTDELYEKYISVDRVLFDDGGHLRIDPLGVNIQWSHADGESGFVYYSPNLISFEKVSESEFDEIDFAKYEIST